MSLDGSITTANCATHHPYSARRCCVESGRTARDRVAVPLRVQIVRASSVNAISMRRCARVNAEFVVAAPKVLHERVATHHDAGGVVAFEATASVGDGL
jgi:hypothetical protein